MSDTSTQTDPAAAAADPTAGAAGAATDTGAAQPDPFDNAETTTFDRAYVERLRSENASYRTRAKEAADKLAEYDDVFGNIDPEDRKVWLGMAKTMYADPAAGAKWLADVAAHVQSGLTQEQAEAAAGAEPTAGGTEEKPLTAADFERMYQERKAAEAQESEIAAITREAKELGYEDGTVDYDLLLGIAFKQTNGDLKAAHQVILDARQAVIDQYVADKAKDGGAAQAPAGGLPVASGGKREIKSIADADAAAKARFAALAESGASINTARRGRRG